MSWLQALTRTIAAVMNIAVAIAAVPDQETAVERGRAVYLRECASCHGAGATGFGAASWFLKTPPPDLTTLSNATTPFPGDAIRNVVTGRIRLVPSHGRDEMPVWRHWLGAASVDGTSEIDALLAYLKDIQVRPFGPYQGPSPETLAGAGAPLFKLHCAGCHGDDGRGRRPEGAVAGIPTPDLTTLAARWSAPVDIAGITKAIARSDGDADREMPNWERALRHAGWGGYLTARHLESLAYFVASIQQR